MTVKTPDWVGLFKSAAADESLTDAEVRNIVRFISTDPVTEADIQRTHELATRKYCPGCAAPIEWVSREDHPR